MFGKNEKIGQRYFNEATQKPGEPRASNELLVVPSSPFITLQGEGPYSGCPAIFLRLTHCNLACTFCDTYFDEGRWMNHEEIIWNIDRVVRSHFGWNMPSGKGPVPAWAERDPIIAKKRELVLVITGGEPMLQKAIVPFCERMLLDQFEEVQIESNGLIVQPIPDEVYLVVSPKCHEEGGKPTKYAMPNHLMLERADCLKFVMSAEDHSPYQTIPQWALDWRRRTDKPVFISPMNIYNRPPTDPKGEVVSFWEPGLLNMEANQKNHEHAARYVLNNGLRLSLQTHLLASLA